MSDHPKCKKCGRKLSDPVSIAIGVGPECRGDSGGSHRLNQNQKRRLRNIYRADAFARHAPIVLGADTTYYRDEKGWSKDGQHYDTDEGFKSWLEQFNLADFAALDAIEKNRLADV